MTEAVWQNGKRRVSGRYTYRWAADVFVVYLDSTDRITGAQRRLEVHSDRDYPEWGNWKLVKGDA